MSKGKNTFAILLLILFRKEPLALQVVSMLQANSSLQLYEKDDILLGAMRVYFHRVCIAAQNGITRTTTMILKPADGENYLGYAYSVLNDDRTILYANQNSNGTQQPYIKLE